MRAFIFCQMTQNLAIVQFKSKYDYKALRGQESRIMDMRKPNKRSRKLKELFNIKIK